MGAVVHTLTRAWLHFHPDIQIVFASSESRRPGFSPQRQDLQALGGRLWSPRRYHYLASTRDASSLPEDFLASG